MAIGVDFTIDDVALRIHHDSGATVYSVNDLYSWLMDQFDSQAYMDQSVPMSAQTPTEYTMENGWFLDIGDGSTAHQFLDGGAIQTIGYTGGEIKVITVTGGSYNDPVSGDRGKLVSDDGTPVGPLVGYIVTEVGVSAKWYIRDTRGTHVSITGGSTMTIAAGTGSGDSSGASVSGEDLFANIYSLGTIEAGSIVYIYQSGVRIPGWWTSGHIDLVVKVKEAGTEIDGAEITVFIRQYTDLFDNFAIDLTAGGRNAVPLATSDDLDNATALATVANYVGQGGAGAPAGGSNTGVRIAWVSGTLGYDAGAGATAPFFVVRGKSSDATAVVLETTSDASDYPGLQVGDYKGTFQDNEDLLLCQQLYFDALSQVFSDGSRVIGDISDNYATIRKIEYTPSGTVGILHVSAPSSAVSISDNEVFHGSGQGFVGNSGAATANVPNGMGTNVWVATVSGSSPFITGHTILKDIDDGNGPQPYDVIMNLNGDTVADMYEWTKSILKRDVYSRTYRQDDAERFGEAYIIAYSGYAPKKGAPLGTFAGGTYFGARGVWIENMNAGDVRAYQLIDGNNVTRDPPNLQNYVITALSNSDRLAVFLTSGGQNSTVIDKWQYYVASDQNLGVNYLTLSSVRWTGIYIPKDTPTSGTVRITSYVDSLEDIYTYTSISSDRMTIILDSNTSQAYVAASDNIYIPYIDRQTPAATTQQSVTVTYSANRYVVLRVRQLGIVPFQIAGEFTSGGLSIAAIRTVDSIASGA